MSTEVENNAEHRPFIPEVGLYKAIKRMIAIIEEDYNAQTNKDDTLLADMFKDLKVDDYDYFNNAVAIFIGRAKEPKKIDLTMGYNLDRAAAPHIHILMPNETPQPSPIGGNVGYSDDVRSNTQYTRRFTHANFTTFNLVITSNNPMDVQIIYTMLKCMFLSLYEHLEIMGYRNCVFGGSDLVIDDDLVPSNIFHRNFNVSFDYDFSMKSAFSTNIGKNFIINSVINNP